MARWGFVLIIATWLYRMAGFFNSLRMRIAHRVRARCVQEGEPVRRMS